MKLAFSKYQGTGNDFILLDNREQQYAFLQEKDIAFLCNRRFGIGADGLILLERKTGFDFHMKYYNSDGRESSMCGNGGRCITAYADSLHVVNGSADFTAVDGPHKAIIVDKQNRIVRLKMNDVAKVKKVGEDLFLDTGSPHYVRFVDDVMALDVKAEGRSIRMSQRYAKEGTNVNFVQSWSKGIFVRTYERGVEDETLSCGTGVTAAVLAAVAKGVVSPDTGVCHVKSMGGDLKVYFRSSGAGFTDTWLEGEARFVYSGEIDFESRS